MSDWTKDLEEDQFALSLRYTLKLDGRKAAKELDHPNPLLEIYQNYTNLNESGELSSGVENLYRRITEERVL